MAANSRLPGVTPGILLLLLLLTVNLAPLALGSNRPLPWSYNAVLSGAILVTASLWQIIQMRTGSPVSLRPVLAPLILFVLVMLWVAVQVLPFPHGALINPVWQAAAEFDGTIVNRTISINPLNTLDAAMRFMTYASVFLAAYMLTVDPARAALVLRVYVGSAFVYAVYGLSRYGLQWNKILWFESTNVNLTGPFIGQNNAATYFGLAVICALALLLQSVRRTERTSRNSSDRYRLVAAVQALSGRPGMELAVFVILLVALLLTTSRAGILATFSGCLTLVALRALRQGRGRGAQRFAGFAIVAVLFVAVLEMSGGRFAERILAADIETGGRFEVYRMTWAAVLDNAWFGSGLGTFQDTFPIYRDNVLQYGLTWDKAHNDYLELVLGLGLPAASLFLLALALIFANVLRGHFLRRRDSIYTAVAASASVLVALHALVDFSLQIEAVAMAYAMLMGMGLAQSRSSQPVRRR